MPEKTRRTVTNTTAETERNPLGVVLAAMLGGTSNTIEAMEAAGQQELAEADVLPAEMDDEARAALVAAGVVFGAPVKDDPLFVEATLPKGWRKRATDHSMHSDLLDERGRKRGFIFYKAAFYDRKASLGVLPRFVVDCDYTAPDAVVRFHVLDAGAVIYTVSRPVQSTHPVKSPKWYEEREPTRVAARKEACAWLAERRPDYTNRAAYWNEP